MLCRARLVETSQTIVVGSIQKCLPWAYLFFSVVHFFFKAASVKNFTCMNLDVLIFSVIHGPVLRISKRANSAQIALCAVLLSCDKRSEIFLDKRRRRNKEQLFLIEFFLSGRHNDIQNVSF